MTKNNDLQIIDGWLAGAKCVPSPNYNERPGNAPVDLVVIHNISLPPNQYGGPHIEALFTNQLDANAHPYFAEIADLEVSAHFLIRRDGNLIQFVSVNDRAWHAGRSAGASVRTAMIFLWVSSLKVLTWIPTQTNSTRSLECLLRRYGAITPVSRQMLLSDTVILPPSVKRILALLSIGSA